MSRFFWIPMMPLCLSCAVGPRSLPSHAAVPIKSACAATSRSASAVGLEVRAGRRHSDARTIAVTNLTDRPRTVRVQQVARVEGACSGEWARQTSLAYVDAATGEAPLATTVKAKEALRIQIGEQRVAATWDCTKLGLALWLEVDDEVVCADAGSWIAERDAEERE